MAFIGTALLRRLIAEKAKLPLEEVDAVLNAETEVLTLLLESGAKVRVLSGQGYLAVRESKPTRKMNPRTGQLIEISAKRRVVYRESKRK